MGFSRAASAALFIALLCSLEVHAAKAKLDLLKQQRLDHGSEDSSEVSQKDKGYGLCKPCQDYAIKKLLSQKETKKEGVTLKMEQRRFPAKVAKETAKDPNNPYTLLGLNQKALKGSPHGSFFTKVSRAFLEKVDAGVSEEQKKKLEAARDLLQDLNKRAAYDMAGPKGLDLVPKAVGTEKQVESVTDVGSTAQTQQSGSSKTVRFSETGRHLRSETEEPCTISLVLAIVGAVVMAATQTKKVVDHMKLPEMRPLADALLYSKSTIKATEGVLTRLQGHKQWSSAPASDQLKRLASDLKTQLRDLKYKIETVKDHARMGDPNNPDRYNAGERNWHRFDWKSIATLGIGNIVVSCAINSNDQACQQKALAEVGRIRDMSNLARASANELNHAFTQSLVTS